MILATASIALAGPAFVCSMAGRKAHHAGQGVAGVNGSEMFWRRVIIAFAIICVFYMLVALCIALRQLGGGVPIKFDPLSWPIELLAACRT